MDQEIKPWVDYLYSIQQTTVSVIKRAATGSTALYFVDLAFSKNLDKGRSV